jgi:hypothetical protein
LKEGLSVAGIAAGRVDPKEAYPNGLGRCGSGSWLLGRPVSE